MIPFGYLASRFEHLIDDAFISFRYAHNWAAGNGLRYNLGDGPPVEGFSNFLWVALLALGERCGVAPEHLANIISITCGAALIWLFHRVAVRDLKLRPASALLGALFLACFPPFAVWCTGGLETAAFALLLFACWRELSRPSPSRPLLAGCLAVVLLAIRPEGLVWAVGLLFASCVSVGRGAQWCGRIKRYLPILAAGALLLLLGRYLYFGEWISNTARAKGAVSGETLLRGLKVLASYWLIFLSPFVVLILLPWARRIGSRRMLDSAAIMLLSGMVYNVAVGGDWMAFFRFLAPLTPFLALLLAAGLDALPRQVAVMTAGVAIALSLLPAFNLHLAPFSLRERVYFRSFLKAYETEYERFETSRRNTDAFARTGRALSRVAGPGDSLVMGAIGAIGYYSNVTIHDRNGLVDRQVASRKVTGIRSAGHDKRVARSFFAARRPTWYEMTFNSLQTDDRALVMYARSILARAVREYPEERALRDLCYPVRIPLAEGEGQPAGALFGLLGCDDPERARAVWASFGVR